jgi:hypothetical protein
MEGDLPPRIPYFVPYHHEFSMGANAGRFKTNVWMIAIRKSYRRPYLGPVVCRLADCGAERWREGNRKRKGCASGDPVYTV